MTPPLSQHARQRMAERNISHSEVLECLSQGEDISAAPGQRRVHHLGLVVVLNCENIITVYRRPSLLRCARRMRLTWSLSIAFDAAFHLR